MNGQEQAGPSQATQMTATNGPAVVNGALTQRQREKSRAVTLDDIVVDDDRIDHVQSPSPTRDRADRQDLSLLISQYLHAKPNSAVARMYDEEVLGVGRGKQRLADIEEVERAITGTCCLSPSHRPV